MNYDNWKTNAPDPGRVGDDEPDFDVVYVTCGECGHSVEHGEECPYCNAAQAQRAALVSAVQAPLGENLAAGLLEQYRRRVAGRLVLALCAGALFGSLIGVEVAAAQADPFIDDPLVQEVLEGSGEGYILPVAPRVEAEPPARRKTGPSRWAFWSALVAQGATVVTQEYAYAHFGVYGANKGVRVRSAALNLAPVVAVGVFGKWLARADADAAIVPSIGWGTWGAIRNVRDIKQVDRILRERGLR